MAEVPASVLITKDNLFVQVHANVYNLINNRSNVPDPNDDSGNRKFVYVREPNYMGTNFAGFPYVQVPYSEYEQGNKTVDASKAYTSDSFEIIIMTSDKSSDSEGNPSGARQMADIKTNILKTLNNKTNAQTLRNNGLRNRMFPSVTFDWGEVDGKHIFRTEFNLMFNNQLRRIA